MKNKLLLILFVGLFLISFASATSELTYKQNDFINRSFVCLDTSNDLCASTTTCQITITDPRGDIAANNRSMGYTSTSFYYSLPTSEIGIYDWLILCKGSTTGKSEGNYEITPSGFVKNIGFYILILLFSFGIIILGLSLKDAWITILGTLGLYFLGLYVLLYGIIGLKDTAYTWGIGLVLLGIAMYISVKSAWEMIGDS